jgi:hypothetical protein
MMTDKDLEDGSHHLYNTTNLPGETTENHGKETSIRIVSIPDQIETWVPLHINSVYNLQVQGKEYIQCGPYLINLVLND